jgi:hypothetical protein
MNRLFNAYWKTGIATGIILGPIEAVRTTYDWNWEWDPNSKKRYNRFRLDPINGTICGTGAFVGSVLLWPITIPVYSQLIPMQNSKVSPP